MAREEIDEFSDHRTISGASTGVLAGLSDVINGGLFNDRWVDASAFVGIALLPDKYKATTTVEVDPQKCRNNSFRNSCG